MKHGILSVAAQIALQCLLQSAETRIRCQHSNPKLTKGKEIQKMQLLGPDKLKALILSFSIKQVPVMLHILDLFKNIYIYNVYVKSILKR